MQVGNEDVKVGNEIRKSASKMQIPRTFTVDTNGESGKMIFPLAPFPLISLKQTRS